MKTHRILSREEGYRHFREKYRGIYTLRDVRHRSEHNTIVSNFYKKVAHYIAENKEGVYIEGFGYFGVMNTGNKVNLQYQKNLEYNWETKGYAFTICFVPDYSKSVTFRTFSFDFMYSLPLKKALRAKLESGFRYIFNPIMIFKNEK